MEDNIVYDNWTQNLYISDTTNCLVQRNIVYVSSQPAIPTRNNSHPGLTLADEVASVPPSANNTIINNFIYNTGIQAFSWTLVANSGLKNVLIAYNTIVDGDLITGTGGGYNIVNTTSQIRNNIITGTGSAVPSNSGITFSNNNWGATPALAVSASDVIGNPKIARTGGTSPGVLAGAYFKVLATSPVIHAGAPLGAVTTDFFLTTRPATPTIGGHEYTSLGVAGLTGARVSASLGTITTRVVYPSKSVGLSGRSIASATGGIVALIVHPDKSSILLGIAATPRLGVLYPVITYAGVSTTTIGIMGVTLSVYTGGVHPNTTEEHHGLGGQDTPINMSTGSLTPVISFSSHEIGLLGIQLTPVNGFLQGSTTYAQSRATEWVQVCQPSRKVMVQRGVKKITVQHTGKPVH